MTKQKASSSQQALDMFGTGNEKPLEPLKHKLTEKAQQESEVVTTLISRIRNGHDKLWERWAVIRDMSVGPGLTSNLGIWDSAVVKLQGLNLELRAKGHDKCLYDKAPDHPCLVCPRTTWRKEECLCWNIEL